MTEDGFKRKLAAILSADVEGYSLLMDQDEEGTIRSLKTFRTAMTDLILQYRGRVVDSPGDNLLAEFTSVVDAVNCAVEVQREFAERNAELPENRRMQFRIGVNLGDVVDDKGRIYGDGVNIAARVESMAEAGGICITGRAYDQIANKLGLEYENLGEHQFKNISTPIRVYRVLSYPGAAAHRVVQAKISLGHKWRNISALAVAAAVIIAALGIWQFYTGRPPVETASLERMAFPLPDKPSIAVLPFDNMSGDPGQEYIADGISENIITAISKIPNMFVIARNSAFTYKGKPVKVQQVSEELGVRFVLEGSVQRSGEQIRITAQLIDAISGHHLWAQKYDRELEDIFDILDEITKKIVVTLQVKLTHGEETRLSAKGTNNLGAWEHYIKGRGHYWRFTKADNRIAREFFEQAIKIDPNFAAAWAGLASAHGADVDSAYTKSTEESFKQSVECAERAISLDESSPWAHSLIANVYLRQGLHHKAIEEGEKAVALAPSSAVAHVGLGRIMHFTGQPEEAIRLITKAMRLSPYYPANYLLFIARAYHQAGDYEDAIATYQHLLERCKKGEAEPLRAHVGLVVSYLEVGQKEKALNHASEVLGVYPKYPFVFVAKRNLLYEDLNYLKRLLNPVVSIQRTPVEKLRFVYEGKLRFHLDYPNGSKKLPNVGPPMVLGMKSAEGVRFFAGISDIPKGVQLSEVGPEIYVPNLKSIGSNFEVLSNNEISLSDGTKAYKTEVKWLSHDGLTWINSIIISAFKGNNWVYSSVHPAGDPDEVAWIAESLSFE